MRQKTRLHFNIQTAGQLKRQVAPPVWWLPRQDVMWDLIRRLVQVMREPFGLLYVLVVPRGEAEAARYQSPHPILLAELQIFLSEFQEFLEKDARHHFWIGATDKSSLLAYDNHNVIYAYGPLETFESVLRGYGLSRCGAVKFPVPHMHKYNREFDEQANRLHGYWDWIKSPLQESDDH